VTAKPSLDIVPLKKTHLRACSAIVAASDPWRRLGETIDFPGAMGRNSTGTKAYACMEGRNVAGFVLFIPEPVFARGGYLRAIGVAPAFRGRGVGRKLLAFAEQKTSERALHLFLCVSSFNRPALAFYKKCGYRGAGRLPGLIKPGTAELIFWKRLKRRA
jgi:ribosomal protein S18 acetylase RimI-like enzyme